ncbi:MAG: hypothetical protein ACK4F9_03700 [Brevinematia bacterium]
MVGVILFSLCGMFFGFFSAYDLAKKIFRNDKFEMFLNRLSRFDLLIGIAGIFVGLWNLFSPNFGFKLDIASADITLLGALVPSSLVILSGASICLHYILQFINVEMELKDKILSYRNQYGDLIGVLTFVFSLLHLVTYNIILL